MRRLSSVDAHMPAAGACLARDAGPPARFSDTAALFVALGGGWWNQKPDPAGPA